MKYKLSIILISLSLNSYSQEFKVYDEIVVQETGKKYQLGRHFPVGYEVFNNNGKLCKIRNGYDKNDETNLDPSYLVVRSVNMDNTILKESIIKDNDIDTEYSSFGKQYIGQRKFAIIRTRFDFHILNLTTDILITPKYSIKRENVDLSDAQGFNLRALEIFDNGQYLIFNKSDFGTYCLNLMDLYFPKIVEAFYIDPPMSSEYYVFLDHRKDDIYNAIRVKRSYREIQNIEYLFQGYRFLQDKNGNIIHEKVEDSLITLQHIGKDGTVSKLTIDIRNGNLVE